MNDVQLTMRDQNHEHLQFKCFPITYLEPSLANGISMMSEWIDSKILDECRRGRLAREFLFRCCLPDMQAGQKLEVERGRYYCLTPTLTNCDTKPQRPPLVGKLRA